MNNNPWPPFPGSRVAVMAWGNNEILLERKI